MYEADDPRQQMKPKSAPAAADPYAAPAGPKPGFAAAEYLRFYQRTADEDANGAQTWFGRGQNFLVAYSRTRAGSTSLSHSETGSEIPCSGMSASRKVARRSIPFQAGRKRASASCSIGSTSFRSAASEARRRRRSTSGSHHSRSLPPGRSSPLPRWFSLAVASAISSARAKLKAIPAST